MSSQSKRRAESEEVTHKKKLRKGEDQPEQDDEDIDGGLEDDEPDAVDTSNIISTRRTRGKRVDYTEDKEIAGLGDDTESQSKGEGRKEEGGASTVSQTRSPQRKPEVNIRVDEDEEDEEDEEDYGDEDDDGGEDMADDDDEDEDEDDD